MPYDPNPLEEIQVVPLSGLYPDGQWQIELAHDRDTHVLVWITRGQGRVLLDGTRRGFGAHNALFVPAGGLMSLELGRGCLGQALLVPASNAIALPYRPQHLRINNLNEQTSLTALLDTMQHEQNARETMWHRAMQANGELIGILLRRQNHSDEAAKPKHSAAHRLTQAYCARISQYYGDNISMSDHASALGVTATHLTRVIKAETGTTAAGLLTERQLYAARCLLIESDLPIQEIATRLNFSSSAYFTRFITQHTNQTPRALRKQSRN
ncbi:AraC family transcriptional regulator [Sedimentitalea sp. CY04]|uniref:AraC family transcriptional regulator n=1 Tax=Parasedimentitalea denitrificans TaxID=2211118 RepID=A0ABX0WBY8_9RHOB|nr:AraC family transcriptional regulator [Sedimentitalea sp. CY04]NIZ62976.1 AraC family transcriptional regulator [Sedimentitalea sp. CY04]